MNPIENQTYNGLKKSITAVGASATDTLAIRNCNININEILPDDGSAITGIDITKFAQVDIHKVIARSQQLTRKFGYILRSGYSGDVTKANKLVRISDCDWSGLGPPFAGYTLNRDIIASEIGDGELWIKDSTLSGATDAIIDCKTKTLKVARCTISDAYRLVRLWQNVTAYFVNCAFDGTGDHFWFYNGTSKAILYDCVFRQAPKTSYDQAPGLTVYTTVNPLTDQWFAKTNRLAEIQAKRVAVEQELLDYYKTL